MRRKHAPAGLGEYSSVIKPLKACEGRVPRDVKQRKAKPLSSLTATATRDVISAVSVSSFTCGSADMSES